MKIFFAIVFLGAFGFVATRMPSDANPGFTTIRQGVVPGGLIRGEHVIDDALTFKNIWGQLQINRSVPHINFKEETVIVVLMGNRTAKEYATKILKVTEDDANILVLVEETSPTIGCATTEPIFAPYHVIRIPKTEKQIRFSYQLQTLPCK